MSSSVKPKSSSGSGATREIVSCSWNAAGFSRMAGAISPSSGIPAASRKSPSGISNFLFCNSASISCWVASCARIVSIILLFVICWIYSVSAQRHSLYWLRFIFAKYLPKIVTPVTLRGSLPYLAKSWFHSEGTYGTSASWRIQRKVLESQLSTCRVKQSLHSVKRPVGYFSRLRDL